jgi:acyl carrier protein
VTIDDGLEAPPATRGPIGFHPDDGENRNFSGAIDPTGMTLEEVLPLLRRAVAECLDAQFAEAAVETATGGSKGGLLTKVDPHSLSPDRPLTSLGMDSMRGIQLQSILESRFTVQLPDELMFEPDATIKTLGNGTLRFKLYTIFSKL